MKPLSWRPVILVALAALLIGAGLTAALLAIGHNPIVFTPWLGLLFALVAVITLVAGLGVRRYRRGTSRNLTALQVARIAMFARSAVINGAAFTGFLLGVMFVCLFRVWAPVVLSAAWGSGIAAAGALTMTLIAVLVEYWCRHHDDGASGVEPTENTHELPGTAHREKP